MKRSRLARAALVTVVIVTAVLVGGCTPSNYTVETHATAAVLNNLGLSGPPDATRCVDDPNGGTGGWIDRGINRAGYHEGDWVGFCETGGGIYSVKSQYFMYTKCGFWDLAAVHVTVPSKGTFLMLFARSSPSAQWGTDGRVTQTGAA